jgi:glycosyltransferase involved in cell wall biosynthesis
LEEVLRPGALASAMCWMLENTEAYQKMREAAWAKARAQHSREHFEERLSSYFREVAVSERVLA